jgi:hypothetical protein
VRKLLGNCQINFVKISISLLIMSIPSDRVSSIFSLRVCFYHYACWIAIKCSARADNDTYEPGCVEEFRWYYDEASTKVTITLQHQRAPFRNNSELRGVLYNYNADPSLLSLFNNVLKGSSHPQAWPQSKTSLKDTAIIHFFLSSSYF